MGIVCTVDRCNRPARAKGLCISHYHRLRAYGSATAGAPQRGYVKEFYENTVLVYDGDECLTWPYASTHGRATMGSGRNTYIVSRLVCAHVHGPAPTPDHEAAHSCGRGHLKCVAKRHLSWKTSAENKADRIGHDTHKRGERTWCAKLTSAAAQEIFASKGAKSQRALALQFGVSREAVRNIHDGKSWAWLTGGNDGNCL